MPVHVTEGWGVVCGCSRNSVVVAAMAMDGIGSKAMVGGGGLRAVRSVGVTRVEQVE